jgi:predicted unusual protein kinase regulating ubiquinone biosynthesis (AarF/ABC1/UbiB family)
VVAGFAAAAAAYLAVKQAGERRRGSAGDRLAPGDAPVTSTSRARRSAELARIGGAAGAGYAAHKVRAKLAASDEKREELAKAFELRTAEQVAEALGGMKGALMKLGQMASYLDQGLAEPVRDALAQLQADAPPMAAELAVATIEQDLGAPVGELFASFEETPLAAASIGQVHRAVLHDGRAVAVKVQYPGVDDAIRADLANAGVLFQGVGMLFPGLDPKPIVEEMRARVLEELDYHGEARNQQLFADYYRGHPFVHVPDVVQERSATRVLTTVLADGARFDEVRSWSQEQRDLAGEAIYRFVMRSLYRLHAFNGDPHPGNYLFQGDGRVVFLDFGLVKHFDASEVQVFTDMVRSMVLDRDVAGFRKVIEGVGLLPAGAPFDDDLVGQYFGHFYEFVLEPGPVTMTPEYASETVRRIFDTSGPFGDIMRAANVPPSFVLIQRINLGLYAVLADLGATADWRRISEEIWPFFEGPPSTPLGEAEAEWASRIR